VQTSNSSPATVIIDIRDVGGGLPFGGPNEAISTPATSNKDLIGIDMSGLRDCTGIRSDGNIKLVNKQKVMTCTLDTTSTETFTDVPISITLDYNYYVSASTPIAVLKSLDSTGSISCDLGLAPIGDSSPTSFDVAYVSGSLSANPTSLNVQETSELRAVFDNQGSNQLSLGFTFTIRDSAGEEFDVCTNALDFAPGRPATARCLFTFDTADVYTIDVDILCPSNDSDCDNNDSGSDSVTITVS